MQSTMCKADTSSNVTSNHHHHIQGIPYHGIDSVLYGYTHANGRDDQDLAA